MTHFDELGLACCSPSNLRYLCHAAQLWQWADELGLDRVHVVEVGGGYGGLAVFAHTIQTLFGPRLGGYTLIDVPEASALQRAYTSALGLPVRCVNGLDADALDLVARDDQLGTVLFVSIYAFSEFDADMRAWYEQHLLPRCPHGFLVWNFAEGPLTWVADKPIGGPPYPFTDKPLHITPERPLLRPGQLLVRY